MKKMIALGMAAMMCLSMTACSVSTSSKTETTAAATKAAETTAEAAKDSETTAEAAGDLVATADYPTKPITMIIPYGAGGTTDTPDPMTYQIEKHIFVQFQYLFHHNYPQ
mgnify:CR=1 FL=1